MSQIKAIAIVGMGAILPDAFNVNAFWENILHKKDSIREVPGNRWNVDYYFNPDPKAPDKTYSKIGAWVQGYQFDPFQAHIAIPPKVLAVMDEAQQWAIAACLQALQDYGYPQRPLNPERVAVILGNANAGESHYRSTLRICAPEYIGALESVAEFQSLPASVRAALSDGMRSNIQSKIPDITEDTMPGELSNIIAGRVANVFNFSGPNFVTDAACASSLAAMETAMEGLLNHKFDAAITGGVDRNMGPESFVKFSKIGALSPDGSRPYADGANGFVMGEGAVIFLLKRLEDAEAQGDTVYAVIRGVGGSSDGKGKGITAPNPLGQQRALERAWKDSGLAPESVSLIEGHGTSTRVGDVAEVGSMNSLLGNLGLPIGSVAIGSVKSNIGHLKSAAGAAGVLKVVLGLHHKTLPPSANFERPNPAINFDQLPFRVNTTAIPWEIKPGETRRAGVSSFGFGGTNFHMVIEEYLPGILQGEKSSYPSSTIAERTTLPIETTTITTEIVRPVPQETESVVMSSAKLEEIQAYVLKAVSEKTGYPSEMLDMDLDLEADLGIDTVKQAELFAMIRTNYGIPRKEDLRLTDYNTLTKVVGFVTEALSSNNDGLPSKISSSTVPDVKLEAATPIAQNITEAQEKLKPYQGLMFLSADSVRELASQVEQTLTNVKIGQLPESVCPSPQALAKMERLAIDYADSVELLKKLEKVSAAFANEKPGVWPALQGQGVFRGSGKHAKVAFMFPGQGSQYVNMLKDLHETEPVVVETFAEADRVMTPIFGKPLTSYIYVDGDDESIAQAEKNLKDTTITQPAMLTANVALLRVLQKYGINPDVVIGHSLGEYAALVAAGVLTFSEALQVVSVRGREMAKVSMADNGCMAAVSAPLDKVETILQTIDGYVVLANINSPVQSVIGGATAAVDQALIAFQEAGFQAVKIPVSHAFHTQIVAPASGPMMQVIERMDVQTPQLPIIANVTGELYPTSKAEIVSILGAQVASPVQMVKSMQTLYSMGVRIFVEVGPKRVLNALATDNLKDRSDVTILATNHPRKGGKASFNEALCGLYAAGVGAAELEHPIVATQPVVASSTPLSNIKPVATMTGSVVVTGAGLGLPGRGNKVFDDQNIQRLMNGEMMIEALDTDVREGILDKRVTRLVKSDAGAVMEEITDLDQTLKLSGQRGDFDLVRDFGVPAERVDSLDISTQLAIAAGIDALKDAGIPLVMNYRKTSKGTLLPDRLKLPESLQDETGIVFCSAFPGLNRIIEESNQYTTHQTLSKQLEEVKSIRDLILQLNPSGQTELINDLDRRRLVLEDSLNQLDYHFDRRYIFRILSMGHSQFAEYIGARGPVTHVNAACATTTHGVAIAEDLIRSGRCRRMIVIAGDDVTNPNLVPWIGTSLFASGAATTEGNVRMAAIPFDRRRNGMIMGMGAAALVIESEDAARERGVRAICEIISSQIANSAFHGTRLDISHVSDVMNRLVRVAEERFGMDRREAAGKMVFISHETYTPARGGSASAEIHALRNTFHQNADQVVIANTKGFTGHAMGVGIEDVIAVKSLELGMVPPIAHIQDGFEPDPELGNLNLSKGGKYPIEYALRLGAGFGSQIAMTLYRKTPGEGIRIQKDRYQSWLDKVTGYNSTELEVVQRTLRVRNQGVPQHNPSVTNWQYGELPATWTTEAPSNNIQRMEEIVPVSTQTEIPTVATQTSSVQTGTTGIDDEEVKNYVLSVVSEKTGYPVEMLDLELDLEADLGVDTVKQAELFATIRTHYGIPRREDLRLSEYNTLTKVIGFVTSNQLGDAVSMNDQVSPEVSPVIEMRQEPSVVLAPETQQVIARVSNGEDEAIEAYVLSAVSEKTGYPTEMLDMELDLEADLGIDTVKQAELFAAIRTHYGIPRREDLRLSDYNTLQKVVAFVRDGLDAQQAVQIEASVVPSFPQTDSAEDQQTLLTQISRRVPAPVLRPRLDLCLPTSLTLDQNSEVVVIASPDKLTEALNKQLTKLKVSVRVCTPAQALEKLTSLQNEKAIDGIYFLSSDLSQESIDSSARSIEPLFHALKMLPSLKYLIAATRMGGFFGFAGECNHPLDGLVTGFVKAMGRERDQLFTKVVDLDLKSSAKSQAERLIGETLSDPGIVEVGMDGQLRFGISLKEIELGGTVSPLEQGSTFIVTGGTAGIVAPIVMDLAKATRGTFHLLGRTQLVDANDPRIALLKEDPDALRKQIMESITKAGQKPTPVLVEQQIKSLQRAVGMTDLLHQVRNVGGFAVYHICDVTSPVDVKRTLDEILHASARIDVFIHAAGMDKSRKLETKSVDEFRQVIAAKVDSFHLMFNELKQRNQIPGRVMTFSSVAGRFGNSGQADYSAANDALNKYMLHLQTEYPQTKWISIDWGAWSEVGMASRGNIPTLMSMAGIEMIPPAQAAPLVRRELESGFSGEVILAGSLGQMESDWMERSGVNIEKSDAALREGTPIYTMLSHLTAYDNNGEIHLETDLDPKDHPFLRDHALNGVPVLPGVIGIEGFALAAKHIASVLAVSHGRFDVTSLEDIHFHAPFKFYRNQPRHVSWKASCVRESTGLVVYAKLESTLEFRSRKPEKVLHFSGKVLISEEKAIQHTAGIPPAWLEKEVICSEDIYKLYFHGPSFQVLDCAQRSGDVVLGRLRANLLPISNGNQQTISRPILVELCFQTAGLWEAGSTGIISLPQSIESLTLFRQDDQGGEIYAEVRPNEQEDQLSFDARVVDSAGNVYLELKNYRTAALPYSAERSLVEPLQVLLN